MALESNNLEDSKAQVREAMRKNKELKAKEEEEKKKQAEEDAKA